MRKRSGRLTSLAFVTATLLFVGCIGLAGRGPVPPSPESDLRPETIGVVGVTDRNSTRIIATLTTGVSVTLLPQARLATSTDPVPGSLLLAGAGNPASWWISLSATTYPRVVPASRPTSAATNDRLAQCWDLYGGAFDDGSTIHFSNGLRLAKAADFRVAADYVPSPFPARAGDLFCVDGTGAVAILVNIFQER